MQLFKWIVLFYRTVGVLTRASLPCNIRSQRRSLLLPKTLQIFRHLTRERQVLGIEALNLLDAGSGILSKVENVDLAV
jgi:hypothetical protein